MFSILYSNLYLTTRFFLAMSIAAVMYILSYFFPALYETANIILWVVLALVLVDFVFLFIAGKKPEATRQMADRLSNGDDNRITLHIVNQASFTANFEIIDELPFQFQERDWKERHTFRGYEEKAIEYTLRPVTRGEYHFGRIIIYMRSLLGLLSRRHNIEAEEIAKVYPSFLQLRKYELLSRTTVQSEVGSKRMRKIGHSMEFEQIKEYVRGDDIRTINWKATARKDSLMVNNYTDEKSQQVYCVIDKGRLMKMPFNNLTLLDYAINSTLVLSNVCLKKQDKVGLLTFSHKPGTLLAADSKLAHRENILQLLYNQETTFLESDFEMLYMQVRNHIKQRSLLILFTNFESVTGLKRQLNYLRSMARHHLLMVVFFENTELHQLSRLEANKLDDVYIKTIAEKFEYEKRLIVKELMKHGILSILTTPQNLTVNAVNKYLELKARQAI